MRDASATGCGALIFLLRRTSRCPSLPGAGHSSPLLGPAAMASSTRAGSTRTPRARWAEYVVALAPAFGCADVLGIPNDPELVSPRPVLETPPPESTSEPEPDAPASGGAPSNPAAVDRPNSDGVVPPDQVSGIDGSTQPSDEPAATPDTPPTPAALPTPDAGADAGRDESLQPAVDAGIVVPPVTDCQGDLGRVPVDVVLIVDNTGTMATSNTAFERALPDLADRLTELLVDYRLILISRHRDALR